MFVVLSLEQESGELTCRWLRSRGYDATWMSLREEVKPAPMDVVILCKLECMNSVNRWAEIALSYEDHVTLLWLSIEVMSDVLAHPLGLMADQWLIEGEAYHEERVALALKQPSKGHQEHRAFKRAVGSSLDVMMTQLRQLRRLLPAQALGVEVQRTLKELLDYGEALEKQTRPVSPPTVELGAGRWVGLDGQSDPELSLSSEPILKRVLIIDDEPQMLRALSRLLGHRCVVYTAEGGEAAVAHLEGGLEVDTILCDLMMPGLSGPDFYEILCQRWPHLEPRIVFVTGGGVGLWVQAFEQRMIARIIYKPLTRDVLLQKIEEMA